MHSGSERVFDRHVVSKCQADSVMILGFNCLARAIEREMR